MDKSNLLRHKDSIYKKYNLKGEFSERIDAYQATMGELTNETYFLLIEQINDKVKRERPVNRDDVQILKTVAEKHRTSQPFFVTRTEKAEAKDEDFGRVIDRPTIERPTIQVIRAPKEKSKKKPKPKEDEANADSPEATNNLRADGQAGPGVGKAEGQPNQ